MRVDVLVHTLPAAPSYVEPDFGYLPCSGSTNVALNKAAFFVHGFGFLQALHFIGMTHMCVTLTCVCCPGQPCIAVG